ncbi:hypothetical protein TARUN_2536 [Trichoderma arundinaceum]|uniref:Uncharacterized protein n=1 Tax=Trichoderma arundinaceum TaxID=490622 RepID=A0A395NUA9_TRIAR|nr:hypothetical protein TARUN_2536 [Trichoderma arundinaceum]
MISCGHQGRPDMYGLGIRLGIYMQWVGEMLVQFLDEADVSDIRLLGLLLSGAIALALLVKIVDQDAQPADIYIMLQLAAGPFIFLMPIYIWRILTCCNPNWDPLKWTSEISTPVYGVATTILLVVISALGLWFFTSYMSTQGRRCEHYGFFFAKTRLDNAAYMVVNIVIYVIIIVVCVAIALSWTGVWDGQFRTHKHRRQRHHRRSQREQDDQEHIARRKRARQEQKDLLRTMRGISNLIVYGLHITAIELTIRWNQLDGIDGVDTSAQTIPLLVSIGILLRLVVSHYATKANGSADEQPPNPASRPRPVEPVGSRGHRFQRAQAAAPQSDATRTAAQAPEPGFLGEYGAGIDLDNVSDHFAHGSDGYWLARMAIQHRDVAEQAAATEWQAALQARGAMPRPARVHVRGATIL